MKNVYKTFLALIRLVGVVGIEKVVCAPFYYAYFPAVLHTEGSWIERLARGCPRLFAIQFTVSVILLVIYNWINRDLAGIATLKARGAQFSVRLRERFGLKKREDVLSGTAWFLEFLIFSWQFMPFVALLGYRKGGVRGKFSKEVALLFASTTIATIWWSAIGMGLLTLLERLPLVGSLIRTFFGHAIN